MQSPERKYSIWDAFYLSFFSKDFYAEVGKVWKGIGYGLLLLLVVLSCVPRAIQAQLYCANHLPDFVKKIPDFKIDKGVFSTAVPQPYRLDFAGGCLLMDTRDKITKLDQIPGTEKMQNIFLINSTQYSTRRVRFGRTLDKIETMPPKISFTVNQVNLARWSQIVIDWSGVCLFLFEVLFLFSLEAVMVLIYALVGVFIAEMQGQSMDFGDALRLTVVSHIPGFIIFTIYAFSSLKLPMPFLWNILVSVGFLYFAVSSQLPKEVSTSVTQ